MELIKDTGVLLLHYKNTLGVTPRVTPLCGVTPGVINYSRGVTRERSNCEEDSCVIVRVLIQSIS